MHTRGARLLSIFPQYPSPHRYKAPRVRWLCTLYSYAVDAHYTQLEVHILLQGTQRGVARNEEMRGSYVYSE